jgi:hypothetical protein
MPKFVSITRHQWMAVLPLALAVALPACKPVEQPPAQSPTVEVSPTEPPTQDLGPKLKVKVVEVLLGSDGTIQPIPKVKIKRNRDIVIWATDGASMNITWKAENPLTDFACAGSFCGTLKPSTAEPKTYGYTVTVDGQTLDPDVEVEG